MKRLIFRGKRLDNNEWVYGSLVVDGDNHSCIIDYADYTKDVYTWHPVDADTVGQLTGTVDKNKEKNYEGDAFGFPRVGKSPEFMGFVFYDKGIAAFTVIKPNGGYDLLYLFLQENKTAEIIGNQFDNPGLAYKDKEYPIGGYAPGNYKCKCIYCGEIFTGDKMAWQCEPCGTKNTPFF